jgi:hypothetical protein
VRVGLSAACRIGTFLVFDCGRHRHLVGIGSFNDDHVLCATMFHDVREGIPERIINERNKSFDTQDTRLGKGQVEAMIQRQ